MKITKGKLRQIIREEAGNLTENLSPLGRIKRWLSGDKRPLSTEEIIPMPTGKLQIEKNPAAGLRRYFMISAETEPEWDQIETFMNVEQELFDAGIDVVRGPANPRVRSEYTSELKSKVEQEKDKGKIKGEAAQDLEKDTVEETSIKVADVLDVSATKEKNPDRHKEIDKAVETLKKKGLEVDSKGMLSAPEYHSYSFTKAVEKKSTGPKEKPIEENDSKTKITVGDLKKIIREELSLVEQGFFDDVLSTGMATAGELGATALENLPPEAAAKMMAAMPMKTLEAKAVEMQPMLKLVIAVLPKEPEVRGRVLRRLLIAVLRDKSLLTPNLDAQKSAVLASHIVEAMDAEGAYKDDWFPGTNKAAHKKLFAAALGTALKMGKAITLEDVLVKVGKMLPPPGVIVN